MLNTLNLPDLLKATQELGGSDLHLSMGSPPQVRVDGHLQRLDYPDLTPDTIKALAYSVLTDVQKKKFEETWELDLAFGLPSEGLPLEDHRAQPFRRAGDGGAQPGWTGSDDREVELRRLDVDADAEGCREVAVGGIREDRRPHHLDEDAPRGLG